MAKAVSDQLTDFGLCLNRKERQGRRGALSDDPALRFTLRSSRPQRLSINNNSGIPKCTLTNPGIDVAVFLAKILIVFTS
jgi:hypothetical protein